jgi:hypothetical protein
MSEPLAHLRPKRGPKPWHEGPVGLALFLMALAPRAFGALPGAAPSSTPTPPDAASPAVVPKVVVLVGRAGDAVASRLRAELAMVGLPARVVVPDDRSAASPLEAEGHRLGVRVLVRVAPDGRQVELWIAQDGTGATALAATVVAPPDASSPDEILALRAVELIRASLLDIDAPWEAGSGAKPSATQQERATGRLLPEPDATADSARDADGAGIDEAGPLPPGLAFGFVATQPFDELAQIHAMVALEWMPTQRLGLGGQLLLPLGPATVRRDTGEASVTARLFGGGPRLRLLGGEDPALWTLGANVGAAFLDVRGFARPPMLSESDGLPMFAGYLDTLASFRLSSRVRLTATALFGVVAPKPVIRFAGEEIAAWGQPLFSVGVGAMPLAR